MNAPTSRPADQQCVSPDTRNSKVRSELNLTRVPPTRPRGWRPRSPRVVLPVQKPRDLSHKNKRRRRGSPHAPLLKRKQPPREAKPLPSIEVSAQKASFDPYAFLRHPPTPSLPSLSPNIFETPGNFRSDVGPHDAEPHLSPIEPQEQSFGHRKSANNDDSDGIKREHSTVITPFRSVVIKDTSLSPSLQNTRVRQRKLEMNGVVELDRDEFALQRFLKVQGELTDLEAILMKGKKRHIFEQIKRNAATDSLPGVEEMLMENDATPTPSRRATSLQEGTIGEKLIDMHHSEVALKVLEMRGETSERGPVSTQDAPSTSISGEDKSDRPQKEYRSEHEAVHPSRRHVFDHSEDSQLHEKSEPAPPPKPPKRKELPGMGLIFKLRPNPPQDAGNHQEKKLPRDLQRRQVDMPKVKDTVENYKDAEIEIAIDSAHNWLKRENGLAQEDRAERWVADPNWKRLTADPVDSMRRQSSIPPGRFYGHPPKWGPSPEGRQSATMKGPTITSAKADKILARKIRDQSSWLVQRTEDMDSEPAFSKPPQSKNGKKKSLNHLEKKIQSSTRDKSEHSPTTGTKDLSIPKAKSMSREEKDVMNSLGHEVDSQRSMENGRPAVEPPVEPVKDKVDSSKTKSLTKKRKRDTDVSETQVTTSAMKDVSESPDLPSMKKIIERSQIAVTSSPAKKKKSNNCSGPEAVEDVVNGAKEQGSQMTVTPCPAQREKGKKPSCTGAIESVVNDATEPSTQSRSKKRKKAKEMMGVYEITGEEMPSKTNRRKKAGQNQELEEAVGGKARPETLVNCLRRMQRNEKAPALQEATKERSQRTIPTPEAAKTKKLKRPPPTAPESAVENAWQTIIDDEDSFSPPPPSPSSKKKHKSKRHRRANTPRAIAVDDITPENIESQARALITSQPSSSSFNHLRRRHQSLPLCLAPNTTPPTANPNTIPTQPQPPPNLYDLNLLAIRTRLSNLEAALAANPAPPAPALAPTPNTTLTRFAALKLSLPPLPRAIPPGTTRLSDTELIQIGKKINHYERHRGAPYAFSWRGRLYAEYDYLLDWVDERGRAGWDCKEKARMKQ